MLFFEISVGTACVNFEQANVYGQRRQLVRTNNSLELWKEKRGILVRLWRGPKHTYRRYSEPKSNNRGF